MKKNQAISRALAYFLAFAMIFQSAGAVYAQAGGTDKSPNITQSEQQLVTDGENTPDGSGEGNPESQNEGSIVPSDVKAHSFEVKWNDNQERSDIIDITTNMKDRPEADVFSKDFKLYYSIDGGETFVELNKDTVGNLGLEEVPEVTVDTTKNKSIWTYSYDGLPTKITEVDAEGKANEPIAVTYLMQYAPEGGELGKVDGYLMSDYTRSDDNTEVSVMYTALQNWNAKVQWYDRSVADVARPDLEKATEIYKLYRYVEGDAGNVEEMPVEMLDITVDEKDDSIWNITLKDAPAWAPDGSAYVYYVTQDEDAKGMCKDADKYGEYVPTIANYDNYSSDTSKLFINGEVQNLIVNKTTYTAYKEWEDNNAKNRPASGLIYLYRIIDKADRSTAEAVEQANPVQGYDNAPVPTGNNDGVTPVQIKNSDGETIEAFEIVIGANADGEPQLPMYDNRGNKYIYFGLETGISGDYHTVVNNLTSDESKAIIDDFNAIKTNEGGVKFILNDGIVTNDREGTIEISASKLFVAQSMQSFEETSVEFKLQIGRYNEDGSIEWKDATEKDVVSYDKKTTEVTDSKVVTTIKGFSAEAMGQDSSSVGVNKYDKDTGAKLEYRWVETAVSVNGGDKVDVYDANGNKTADTEDLAQNASGKVVYAEVNAGIVGPGVEDEMTSALFQPTTIGNDSIKNVLIGDTQIKIRKEWYDRTGNISADSEEMEGVYVTFIITRNDGMTTDTDVAEKKLTDANGTPVDNVCLTIADLNSAGDAWVRMISSLPRYDKNGAEYTYTVKEGEITDPHGRSWHRDYESNVSVKQNVDTKDEELVTELYAKQVNTTDGTGDDVIFFEIEKQWLDDVDLLSRKPVTAGIYRQSGAGWELVKTVVLDESNEWKARIYVNKASSDEDTNNYLVKEILVGNVGVEYINYDGDTLSDNDIKNAAVGGVSEYNYKSRVGIVAEDNSYFDEATRTYENGTLDYNYNVYVEETDESRNHAKYLLTNQRVGELNLDLTKTWNAGGVQYDAVFVLYRNNEVINVNDLIKDGAIEIEGNVEVDKKDGSIILTGNGSSSNKIQIKLNNLEKYDFTGALYDYTLEERGIRKDGQEIEFENRKATVDGDTYVSSLGRTSTIIVGKEGHHTGDIYVWEGSNTRKESYTLQANKVWRDDGTKNKGADDTVTVRPDVSFNLYRVSLKNHDDLAELVKSGDSEALAEKLSQYATSRYIVSGDHFWNTKHNEWFWSVDLGGVERYDNEGYAYIYFIKEVYTGSAGKYSDSYCNLTYTDSGYQPVEKPAVENYTTKEVFATTELSDSVTILSDGVNSKRGNYGTYYSATVVNTRQDVRTISGKKIWKVPSGWSLSDDEMPSVDIELYRFVTPITDASGQKLNEVTQAQLNEKIAAEGADIVNKDSLGKGKYSFSFTKDTTGEDLQKYDQWGRSYYYYVSEKTTIDGYSTDEITYTANTYNLTNVYNPQVGPRAKVEVTKTWTSSVEGKTANAPVQFKLYAIQQDEEGNPIGEKILLATKAMKPLESGTNTIDFGMQPYLGTNEQPLKFWVEETAVNGYSCLATSDGAYVGTQDPKKDGFKFLTLTETGTDAKGVKTYSGSVSYKNDYEGGSKNIEYRKTWNDSDKEMDNSEYRLEEIQFEVWRKWSTRSVDGVSQKGGDEYFDTVILNKQNNYTYSKTGVKKYAENGNEYTYYIKAGTETATSDEGETRLFSYTPTQSGSNTSNVLKTVSISFSKKWSTPDGSMDANTFKRLLALGAIPKKVQFLIQRSTDGANWSYVETKTNYGVQVEGYESRIAGASYTVAATNYTNMKGSWDKLPKYALDTRDEYQYRVVERLIWANADGTENITTFYDNNDASNDVLQAKDKIYAPATATSTTGGSPVTTTFTNTIDVKKIQLTKYWDDDNGNRDDTRPDSITLRLKNKQGKEIAFTVAKPAQAGKKNSDGTTSDGYHNSTGGVFVPTPASVAGSTDKDAIAQALNDTYTVSEDKIPDQTIDGKTYSYKSTIGKFVAGESELGIYGLLCTNKGETTARSLVDVTGTKTFASDSEWAELTRNQVRFSIWYQDEKTGAWTKISADEADKDSACYYTNFFTDASFNPADLNQVVSVSGNTGSVKWTKLKEYFERTSETAGEAQKIVYGIQEELLDESGKVVASTSYKASNGTPVAVSNGTASITNTLQFTDLLISKVWKNADGSTIDSAKVKKLVSAGLLPETITFELRYFDEKGELASSGMTQTYKVTDLANGAQKWYQTVDGKSVYGVPKYDKNGKEIKYQISEKSWKYNGDRTEYTSQTDPNLKTDVQNAELDGTYKVTLTNTFATKDISVDKFWDDEEYRAFDKYVRPNVTFTLVATVDGETYDLTQILTDEERIITLTDKDAIDESTWQHKFKNLPKATPEGKEIQYSVLEQASPGYTVDIDWNDDWSQFIITNSPTKYDPKGDSLDVYTPVEATIKKVANGSNKTLAGAIFEVFKDGESLGVTVETDADGLTSFKFEKPGTYTIKEVVAPVGYTLSKEEFTVVVKKSGLIDYDYDEETQTYTNYYELYIEDKSGKTYEKDFVLTVKDNKIPPTGDMNQMTLWTGLFLLAGAGVSGVAVRRRKRS